MKNAGATSHAAVSWQNLFPAAMWGRLLTCGRLVIGLLTFVQRNGNALKPTPLSPEQHRGFSRPITNRPQVNNLPRKSSLNLFNLDGLVNFGSSFNLNSLQLVGILILAAAASAAEF